MQPTDGRRLLRVMPPLRQYTRAPFIAFLWETSQQHRDAQGSMLPEFAVAKARED